MKTITLLVLLFSTIANAQSRYGDRFYYYNVLKSIYGNSIENILQENVIRKPEFFGGACSYMEEIYIKDKNGKPKEIDNVFRCDSLAESKIKPFTNESIFKRSQISKVCTLINNESNALMFSLEGYYIYDESFLVEKLLHKFYPFLDSYSDFSKELIASVENEFMAESKDKVTEGYVFDLTHFDRLFNYNNRFEKIKIINFVLCTSDGWQVL